VAVERDAGRDDDAVKAGEGEGEGFGECEILPSISRGGGPAKLVEGLLGEVTPPPCTLR